MTDVNDTPIPKLEDPLALFALDTEPQKNRSIADRYTVLNKLGQGGMGKVFRAHDKSLDRYVAVKLLNRESCDEHFVLRFQQEARAASQLKHPNILCVLDFGLLESKQPYMVMEWVHGESLEERIEKEHSLNVADALIIALQIAEGMNHAHHKGIIHRDLKPGNIMLARTEREEKALILDFGIAKIQDDRRDGMLTLTGQIIGSPPCISPEQARGEQLDCRADIYSLGCILYWMLTGQPPFRGDSALATINMHLSEPVPLVSENTTATLPDEIDLIVQKMLAKEKADRYASMADVKKAIESIDFEPLQSSIATNSAEVAEPEKSTDTVFGISTKWLFTAAAVLAITSVLIAVPLVKNDNDGPETPKEALKAQRAHEAGVFDLVPPSYVDKTIDIEYEKARGLKKEDYFTLSVGSTAEDLKQSLLEKPQAFHIRFYRTEITPEIVNLIKQNSRITQLRFQRTGLSNEVQQGICALKQLKELKFVEQDLSTDALSQLEKIPNLTNLQIYKSKLNDDALRKILGCKG